MTFALEPERIIRLDADRVVMLDQRRLPDEEVELACRSAAEVADAIRSMAVRGAPAIGIAAAYGYALAVERGEDPAEASALLEAARPTAANLAWALREVRAAPDPVARARELHVEEVDRCRQMSSTRRACWPRGRVRSRTATPAGSRLADRGPRLARCARRGRAGCCSTCSSTRRARCSRARD